MLHINKFIFILLILPAICFGQSKMICDEGYDGEISYGKTTQVKSVSQLPVKIQDNLNGYLRQALGSIYDSISFSHGQAVDLKKYFKHNTEVYKYEWIVTKYDLHFLVHDRTIGIKKYYVEVRMDEFGQIVFCNWPRNSFSNRQKLSQLGEIEKIALKDANRKNYDTSGYTVALEYSNKLDRLCWCFYFNHELMGRFKSYYVISIDWSDHNIIDDNKMIEVGIEY